MKSKAPLAALRALPVVLLFLASCSFRPVYIEDEKKTAERAIEQFHERFNSGQYEAIYDDAHEAMKSAPKDDLLAAMKQTRERSGKIIQVEQHWINYVKGDPIPIRAVYNVRCENGEFSEWFAYNISQDGKKALLVQYRNFPGYSPTPQTSN